MGFLKKVFRPVRKIAKKIIPKEVKPFLPYVAAAFGPATAGLTGTAFAKAAAQKALLAAATSAGTDEQGDPLRAGLLAITPDLIGAGTTKLGSGDGRIAEFVNKTKTLKDGTETMSLVERAQALQEPETLGDFAKVIGGQTAIDQSAKFAEINQDEIDKYNEELRRQGVLDKTKRRASIYNIYINAGYEPDYVNSMLDRYGYDMGGIVEFFKSLNLKVPKGMKVMSNRKKLYDDKDDEDKDITPPKKPKDKKPVPVDVVKKEPDYAGAMKDALAGVEVAFGIPFGGLEPAEFKRFARGGEVEIEEEDDDEYFNILDFMKEQNIPYGEQASNIQNDEILERLFEEYLELGFSPEDAAKKAREEFDRMGKISNQGIMQMASSYRDPMLEEMYEQYVFEMEELGVTPMSFDDFKRQALSGMKDGGKVKRRKKGEPADDVMETEEEIFIDKMPRPKRQGILGAADGGIMEKDMRGGGFIPEGSKERADDVPARLSKNEFVMTADAVRAAGGGSVNQGAKRMYDMMYQLEGKA